MVRLDTPNDAIARSELKQEIRRELKLEAVRKKGAACSGCLFVFILLFGIPTLFVTAVVAKSGLVYVPVFSPALYAPAVPTRTVLPLGTSTSASILRVIGTRAVFDPNFGTVTFVVKEQELTTLLQHAVWEAPDGAVPFKIREAQVVVLPTGLEIVLKLPRKERETTVLARFTPAVKTNGDIEITVQELRIGAQQVPLWLANALVSSFDSFLMKPLRAQLSAVGTLTDIREGENGELKFLLTPAKTH